MGAWYCFDGFGMFLACDVITTTVNTPRDILLINAVSHVKLQGCMDVKKTEYLSERKHVFKW